MGKPMEDYRKDIDSVLLMYSVLRRLGSGEVGTFSQRLRSQKTQYLAQTFGISPAYDFNLYFRGPYSPSLAHDLFKLRTEKVEPKVENFTPEELENRFEKAASFLKEKSIRELELITTLHWLQTVAKLPKDAASKKLRVIKESNQEETTKAEAYVEELCQL
ncbi:MAG: hypothetical protein A2756_04245 [Candidatus Ryanbacteria bacterium RIFCSPHIGHO2_01_FULL_48_27]|uniref:Antitoxin SocA-like Panacea domain-containing protein n=2 Tax=Parcubacteria group TaxID=1794811 RepID=A0A1G1YQB4_9BACT|nr:MAG: hypothetical protein A3A24_02295 [Candidatus Buchananbacteria bacterium RIFCSPLOWO2_01_FULL_46_12]OGZ44434.1 MAG: hypothetical protein A2756_04245 [Candidatus Ryanbacteria bacterium RIFCSPHIGHO2_01_FULL_48_27]